MALSVHWRWVLCGSSYQYITDKVVSQCNRMYSGDSSPYTCRRDLGKEEVGTDFAPVLAVFSRTENPAVLGGVWSHSKLPITFPIYAIVTISTEFVAVS
jgi:hypothetical protein